MLHKDAFIDLPNISLPFTHADLFTDQDYEILETRTAPPGGTMTGKVGWGIGAKETQQKYRDVSVLGFILDKDIMYAMKEHFDKTYNSDIMGDIYPIAHGRTMMPVTLITFSGNTPWHREGFPQAWSTKEFEKSYHSFCPRTRYNYSVNYPLYIKDAENTKVEFAKTSKRLQDLEEKLMMQMMENDTDSETEQSIRVSRSLDKVLDEDLWKDDLEIVGTKYAYDCPYIINLSSYHKVTTTDATRVSLRYMASTEYQWSDIENLYNTGTLFKNA